MAKIDWQKNKQNRNRRPLYQEDYEEQRQQRALERLEKKHETQPRTRLPKKNK